jgi:hypothetical protein
MERFACPCCGHKTFSEPPSGTYDICPVCFWEDDPVQLADPDYSGGANKVSLRQGQLNFRKYGACHEEAIKHVRHPGRNEMRDENGSMIDE